MNLELSERQARLLRTQLERHIDELEKEAARTDRHDLQHALANDVDALKEVLGRVDDVLRAVPVAQRIDHGR
jgi:hypothetical protein